MVRAWRARQRSSEVDPWTSNKCEARNISGARIAGAKRGIPWPRVPNERPSRGPWTSWNAERRGGGGGKPRELARVNLLECGGRRVKEGNENWSLSLRVFGFLSVQSAGVLAFISGGIKWYKGFNGTGGNTEPNTLSIEGFNCLIPVDRSVCLTECARSPLTGLDCREHPARGPSTQLVSCPSPTIVISSRQRNPRRRFVKIPVTSLPTS